MKLTLFVVTTSALVSLVLDTNAFVVTTPVSTRNSIRSKPSSALFAKKKKGKKNKNQQKQSGFAWASSFTLKPFESAAIRDLASKACSSFEGRTGKPLTEDLKRSSDIAKTLWNAPIACVVVGKSDGDEANLIQYANTAALETVGLTADQFEQLLATKDPETGEWKNAESVKKKLDLPSVMKGDKAYEGGYKKKMIKGSEDGQPDITIENAQRWRLEKSALIDGKFVTETLGVAYAWSNWLEGEDTLCSPGGIREVNIDVGELEEKIKAQAALIRELKEVQGFGNKDPEVIDAVEELLDLKALLEEVTSN
jgi:hypothetical protein